MDHATGEGPRPPDPIVKQATSVAPDGAADATVKDTQQALDAFKSIDRIRRALGVICYVVAIGGPIWVGAWIMYGDGQAMPWCEPNEYLWRPWARIALTASSLVFSAGLARSGERLLYRSVTLENPDFVRSQATHQSPDLMKTLSDCTKTLAEAVKALGGKMPP